VTEETCYACYACYARGRKSQGANKPGGEPAKGRKSQTPFYFQCKLEIWGEAQRESAWRPKSDWGKLGGGKFPRHQSHVA